LTTTAVAGGTKVYDYDAGADKTKVVDYSEWITEALPNSCGITSCKVYQSDCITALVAPFDTLIFTDSATPWTLRIS